MAPPNTCWVFVCSASTTSLPSALPKALAYWLQQGTQLLGLVGRDDTLRHHVGDASRYAPRQVARYLVYGACADVAQGCFLRLAQQVDVAAAELVAGHHVDLGQCLGACGFACVDGHLLAQSRHVDLLVVAQGQRTATVKVQDPLALNRDGAAYQTNDESELSHITSF